MSCGEKFYELVTHPMFWFMLMFVSMIITSAVTAAQLNSDEIRAVSDLDFEQVDFGEVSERHPDNTNLWGMDVDAMNVLENNQAQWDVSDPDIQNFMDDHDVSIDHKFDYNEYFDEDGSLRHRVATFDADTVRLNETQYKEILSDHNSQADAVNSTKSQGLAIATGILGVGTGAAGAWWGWNLSKQPRKSGSGDSEWKWAHFAILFYFLLTIAVMLAAFGAAHGNPTMAISGVALMGLMVPLCGFQYWHHSKYTMGDPEGKGADAMTPILPVSNINDGEPQNGKYGRRRLVTLQRIMETINTNANAQA